MLARQIANLTLVRLLRVARDRLSRQIWIKVAVGGRAVAVGAYWERVDVVDFAC